MKTEKVEKLRKFFYKIFHRISISNTYEKKTQIPMNKHVYLGISILELSKILMNEFLYDYVKPKYGEDENWVIWIQTVSLYT